MKYQSKIKKKLTKQLLKSYKYFCSQYKLIVIDLSKQKSDLENQQINFIGRLEQDATIFFIIEEKHTTGLEFLQNSLSIV